MEFGVLALNATMVCYSLGFGLGWTGSTNGTHRWHPGVVGSGRCPSLAAWEWWPLTLGLSSKSICNCHRNTQEMEKVKAKLIQRTHCTQGEQYKTEQNNNRNNENTNPGHSEVPQSDQRHFLNIFSCLWAQPRHTGDHQRIPVPTNSVRPDLSVSTLGIPDVLCWFSQNAQLCPQHHGMCLWFLGSVVQPRPCSAGPLLPVLFSCPPPISPRHPQDLKGRSEKELVALSKLLINQK